MTDKKLLARNIKLSYLEGFFEYLIFIVPIWYAFESQFASPATLGLIYSVSHLITLLLELPSGALADLLGRKKTIIIGLLMIFSGAIIVSQAQSATWLWIAYIIMGVASSFISGADTALYYDSLKQLGKEGEFSRYSANKGIVIRTALVVSSLLSGVIFALHPRLPYLLWGVCVLCASVVVFFYTEPDIDSEAFSLHSYISQTKIGFKQLFKTPYIKALSLYYLVVGGSGWYFLYFLNVAFATEIGFDSFQRSLIIASAYLCGGLALVVLTRLNWLQKNHVYLALPLLLTVTLLPVAWAGKTYAIVAIILIQFVGLARFTLLDQYTNSEFDSKYRATAVSALNMLVSLFYIVLTPIGGQVIARYGAPAMMTTLGIIALVFALPSSIVLVYKNKHA